MAKPPTIDIDMDRKCTRCKKPGATTGGLCLKCIGKKMTEGGYDHLFEKGDVLVSNKEIIKGTPMAKSTKPTQPQSIELEDCGIVGVKADLVAGGARITIVVNLTQLTPAIRAQLAQAATYEQPVRLTIQPMQMSLDLSAGKLE